MGSVEEELRAATGFHHLPLRIRDKASGVSNLNAVQHITLEVPSPTSTTGSISGPQRSHKRCPESLHFLMSNARLRSPTQSSMSSIPDSATTYSHSTVASPLSSSYASDLQEFFTGSRPSSRVFHRHKTSVTTCSTFVNDEDEAQSTGFADKIQHYRDDGEVTPKTESADDIIPISPMTEAPNRDSVIPYIPNPLPIEEPVRTRSPSPLEKWESESEVSEEDEDEDCNPEEADAVLDFTLQMVYGLDSQDHTVIPPNSRQIVQKYIRELSQALWQSSPDSHQAANGMSSSSASPADSGAGDSQRGGKRKKQQAGGGRGVNGRAEEGGEECSEGEGDGFLPVKKMKPTPRDEDNLRLSCPFRKRNPSRFNVRDHHSCAMTFFPKFAELRQHIVKQHKRDDPSAFVCDRCNRDFVTRKELRDHQRLPRDQMCEISDSDPENGIDGPTSTKLLSRKRTSGSSADVQWREIWNILFPDDDDNLIRGYQFTPVIEHFELRDTYLASFEMLKLSLMDKISNPTTLETLATKFHQCFVETVERCIAEAQTMPYANRSNKRGEQLATAAAATAAAAAVVNGTASTPAPIAAAPAVARKVREVLPRPDSGVVMTDDTSEESGSVMGTSNNYRESIRTARSSQRGSSLVPRNSMRPISSQQTHRSSATSSGIFDSGYTTTLPSHSLPSQQVPSSTQAMSFGNGYMAPVDVQAWTSGVQPPAQQQQQQQLYGQQIPEHDVAAPVFHDMTMPPDLAAVWAQQPFYPANMGLDPMGEEFNGFDGRQ